MDNLHSSIFGPESPLFILKVDHHFVRVPEKMTSMEVCNLSETSCVMLPKILLHGVVEQLMYRHVCLLKVVHVPQTIS